MGTDFQVIQRVSDSSNQTDRKKKIAQVKSGES